MKAFKGSRAYPFAYIAMLLGFGLSWRMGDANPFMAVTVPAVTGIFAQNVMERRTPKGDG